MREFKIANKLLSMKQSITIKSLSDEFNVSTRAVKYDLKNIRSFLVKNNITFSSQSGKGVWVDCSNENRTSALNLLSQMQKHTLYFNQEARIPKILFDLFLSNQYITANSLAESLNVSRNTILNDLDYVDILLAENGITLLRKQRVGYKLEGSEINIRSFFEGLVQKNLSAYDVYTITDRIKSEISTTNLDLNLPQLLLEHYSIIEENLKEAFQEHNESIIAKENILLILIKLLLSVTRLKLGYYVGSCQTLEEKDYLKGDLYRCWLNTYKACELTAIEDEILYIEGKYHNRENVINIAALTSELITTISNSENLPYYEDETLYSRIISHLTLSFNEPSSNNFENPFNNSIRKNHYSIFISIKGVCQKYLPDSPLTSNESFISYLVLHFLVTQKKLLGNKKYSAIFVCATGRGAARLVNKMIESKIPEIKVLNYCSLVEIEDVVKKLNPDFIISVFPIESNIPVIVVESLPTIDNINMIRDIIQKKQAIDGKDISQTINILDFDIPLQNPDEISQEVIIIGLRIYNKILEKKKDCIVEELRFAFLSHVMLLAHRYYFKKQYIQTNKVKNNVLATEIREIMNGLDLEIEAGEIFALMNYFISD